MARTFNSISHPPAEYKSNVRGISPFRETKKGAVSIVDFQGPKAHCFWGIPISVSAGNGGAKQLRRIAAESARPIWIGRENHSSGHQ